MHAQTYTLVPSDWNNLPEDSKFYVTQYAWWQIVDQIPQHLQNIPIFHTDNNQSFILTGYAGGASPGGLYSEVSCELRDASGDVRVMRYRLIDDGRDTPQPDRAGMSSPVDASLPLMVDHSPESLAGRIAFLEETVRSMIEKRDQKKRDDRRAAIMTLLDHIGY